MRFARIPAADEWALRGLAEFVETARIELLQLDYHRSRKLPYPASGMVEYPEFAGGFRRPLGALNRAFFLDPDLRVVTDAGWGNAYECVEEIAADLVEGGNRDLLVSAVRGSNLLPILDMLIADGIDLKNVDTGAPWKSLKAPVLAADLKLGAGPLATALHEGARVVVAGSYDAASPLAAAAKLRFGWEWNQYDQFAATAAAAQAATARMRCAGLSDPADVWGASPLIGDLDADGGCRLYGDGELAHDEVDRLGQWLRSEGAASVGIGRADAAVDFSRVECVRDGSATATLRGACGRPPDGRWDLEILYLAGYSTEAFVAVEEASPHNIEAIGAVLHARLAAFEDSTTTVSVRSLGSGGSTPAWFMLECRAKKRRPCMQFIEEARALVSRSHGLLRWGAGPPDLIIESRVWPARAPRSAIDLAVDTRPAHEWL